MLKNHSLKSIWRNWFISQSPRRTVVPWSVFQKGTVLVLCLLIATISSYKLLAVPEVAIIVKPNLIKSFAIGIKSDLSASFTEIKIVPSLGI